MRQCATIIRWNEDKGYGYAKSIGNSQPVFVHVRDFDRRDVRPHVGLKIEFGLGHDKQGRCCASRVRVGGEGASRTIRFNPALAAFAVLGFAGIVWLAFIGRLPKAATYVMAFSSLVAFVVYWADKKAAVAEQWRTQENTLHLLALIGGWPGALLAQQLLRHKSSKASFQFVFWLTVAINIGALAWLSSESGASMRALLVEWG